MSPQPNPGVTLVRVSSIIPNPKNPRIALNQEIVTMLVEAFKANGFDESKPIIVRPKGDGVYEIIDGHHRHEGAKLAKLEDVPVVVRHLCDADAVKLAAISGIQTGWSALEHGIAALHVAPMQGKKDDGLAAYARSVGLDASNLRKYRMGAEVFEAIKHAASGDVTGGCRDKAEHLCAIKRLPAKRWPELVKLCVEERWSLRRTKAEVDAIVALSDADKAKSKHEGKASAKRRAKADAKTTPNAAKAPVNDAVGGVARSVDVAVPTKLTTEMGRGVATNDAEPALASEVADALLVLDLPKPTPGAAIACPPTLREAAIAAATRKIDGAIATVERFNESVTNGSTRLATAAANGSAAPA